MKNIFKGITILLLAVTCAIATWNFALMIKWNKNNSAKEETLNPVTRFEIANQNKAIADQRDTLTIVTFATSAASIVTLIVSLAIPENKKRKRSVK